ncbi:Fc.00g094190.m01.CDS01 [Cosmosporella sp. VM-42]
MADHPRTSTDRLHSQYSDLPEVVMAQSDSAPQAILDDSRPAEKVYVSSSAGYSPASIATGLQTSGSEGKQVVDSEDPEVVALRRPWWKRKRILAIAIISSLAIIGLVVGLAAGLTIKKNDDDTKDSPDSSLSQISCNTTVCPQIFTVSEFNEKFYLFARTNANQIAARTGFDISQSDWVTLEDAPGDIISQPASISWEPEDDVSRLDVMTVTKEGSVWGCHKTDGAWSSWEAMGPYAASQPVLCRVADDRIDVWSNDQQSHNISHIYWMGGSAQRWSNNGGNWNTENYSGAARNAPAAVCHAANITHNLVWYDRDEGKVWHRSWNKSNYATDWKGFDGSFQGDPTLFQLDDDSDRIDFFGVGDDREIKHFSWTSKGGYSELESLGGPFVSVPSFVSLSKGVYDVVALGEDGWLKHTQDNGAGWWDDWETLNASSTSAPLAVVDGDQVRLLYIDENGEFIAATVDPAQNGEWTSLNASSLGSNFTLGFFGDGTSSS